MKFVWGKPEIECKKTQCEKKNGIYIKIGVYLCVRKKGTTFFLNCVAAIFRKSIDCDFEFRVLCEERFLHAFFFGEKKENVTTG